MLASSQGGQQSHPSSFDQLSPEFFGGVVEGELLTAQVVDWGVALQVKKQVIVEAHLFWLLLIEDNRVNNCDKLHSMISNTVTACLKELYGFV